MPTMSGNLGCQSLSSFFSDEMPRVAEPWQKFEFANGGNPALRAENGLDSWAVAASFGSGPLRIRRGERADKRGCRSSTLYESLWRLGAPKAAPSRKSSMSSRLQLRIILMRLTSASRGFRSRWSQLSRDLLCSFTISTQTREWERTGTQVVDKMSDGRELFQSIWPPALGILQLVAGPNFSNCQDQPGRGSVRCA